MKIRNLIATVLCFASGINILSAQQMPNIPIDKNVRIDKLSNGLTYYIRHNDYPEHMANFYIAQKVGSINENDNQRGLAHFLEHMAFNGSEHFSGSGIIDYTRSIGVEFGRNLNAYTSVDRTVYNICDVPTTRQSALDSCLLILKDWSNGLTLDAKEIDKERGVIHDEYRMRTPAMMRMIEKALPMLYPGSKYGYRMPIGLMSIVDNFKPDALRSYYHKWYRPDNQCLVIVGDVDVNHTEAQIKKLFDSIKVPVGAAKVIPEIVPDNNEAIYIVEKDKEQPYSIINIAMKHDTAPDSLKNSMIYMADKYAKNVISKMLNTRLSELSKKEGCPFVLGIANDGEYILSKTKDAFTCIGLAKEGKDIETLSYLTRELLRARQFGFTDTEYSRAKAEYLSDIEKAYTNRNKTKNNIYCTNYYENFLNKEPIPSIEDKYQLTNAIAHSLPINVINMYVKRLISTNDTNLVIYDFMQEKEGKTYITTEDLKNTINKTRGEKLEAYIDNVKNEPLIATLPAKGKIVKETINNKLGYKELKLSNGATVILKKTNFKDDEIKMRAVANGGLSILEAKDYDNAKMYDPIINASGLGNFSNEELQKALAGKKVNLETNTEMSHIALEGNSTPKDIETLTQLTYLKFTNIKKDDKSFNSLISMIKVVLKNRGLDPNSVFEDSVEAITNSYNRRFTMPSYQDVNNINYDRTLQIAKELYSNAGEFTFTFVGNFDENTLRPLIEQYIASLPSTGKTYKTVEVRTPAKGEIKKVFSMNMQTPQSHLNEIWRSNKIEYSLTNCVKLKAISKLLSMVYLKTIREDASAAYYAEAIEDIDNDGKDVYMSITGDCPMDPAKQKLAVDLMLKGTKDAAMKINAEDLAKVKSTMLKQADEDAKDNSHWIDIINDYNEYHVDLQTDYKNEISKLTTEGLSSFLKNIFLSSGNHIEILMNPVKK